MVTSYDTNAQVHWTVDLWENHCGKCVYERIFHIFLIFLVLVISCLRCSINREIFHLVWWGLYPYPNCLSMFRFASSPNSIILQ